MAEVEFDSAGGAHFSPNLVSDINWLTGWVYGSTKEGDLARVKADKLFEAILKGASRDG